MSLLMLFGSWLIEYIEYWCARLEGIWARPLNHLRQAYFAAMHEMYKSGVLLLDCF
jgi:hypothetical protein